jgi:hypothetical protein
MVAATFSWGAQERQVIAMDDAKKIIIDRCTFEPNTGCWLWMMSVNHKGYGRLRFKRRLWKAHRLSYLAFRGPLEDLNVCHTCDIPSCVNPDHLWLGTQMENVQDMYKKNRSNHAVGERSPTAKLTASDVIEIRTSGINYREAMEKYDIGHALYYQIVKRRLWKHI